MKLNARNVAALVRPDGRDDIVIWDDDLPGFGVRLRGDRKTYLIQYRVGPYQRRESLGDLRKVRLDDARKIARQRFAQVELGQDPGAIKKAAREAAAVEKLTLGNVSDRYLDARRDKMRPRSYREAERYFAMHWEPLRSRPIAEITRAHVAACLQDLTKERGAVAAGRARSHLGAMFTWAMREGLCEANPVIATNDPEEGRPSRDRILTMDELAAIWGACQDDDIGRIVRLLVLTACRRAEIGGLRWGEIDFDRSTITISAERAKNGRSLILTLPAVAFDILREVPQRDGHDTVFGIGADGFTSWSMEVAALKNRVAEGKPLAPWTLHDLRRTAATGMADSPPEGLGVQPHIVEAILNHVSGHKGGVAGIYNRARYDREIASALQLWAEHVMAVVEGRKEKVVALRSA